MKKFFFLFLVFRFSFFNGYTQVNLNNGLVAFLPFNGNANDASSNGNNGLTQNGIQLTADRFGNPNSAYLLDGIYDCFSINGAQGAASYELAIYNRFGERVFYAKDPNNCWNGIFKGNPQPSGTFVYYLKMKSTCGLVNEKGTISLLR